MAVYDFRCAECGNIEEKKIPMAEYDTLKESQVCTKCSGKMTRRVDGKAQFSLSGNGWYSMGYGITDQEMNRNADESAKLEDHVRSQMKREE